MHCVLKNLRQPSVAVSFKFVSDSKMIAYNTRYFRKRCSTDVIAFPWRTKVIFEGKPYLGDIVISLDRARAQAPLYENTLAEEWVTYGIHGILHLLGFRDETLLLRKKMFQKQDRLMAQLKVECPSYFRGLITYSRANQQQ